MLKTITSIARWLAHSLNGVVSWLESKDRPASTKSKYVDLAPTDEADQAGVYSEAILFAIDRPNVFNIALTGPYGSGKSSIIQSFLKKYRRSALHISLAAFVSDAGSGVEMSRQEIERSILQQMLYGADANKLPLSRFKRIQSPSGFSSLISLYIMLGILALWYVFHEREDIISGTFLVPIAFGNWLNLASFALAATFLWAALHHLYVASFGLSLKSISLRDVEIKPAHDDETSILNRHLDEIVYFFQSTDYDLVIIEDLDRFDNAEIFVTLRELNTLVNENAGVRRNIRFLYALRDDMFVNTDRTKFFEFIIPVIPIINTSNSIDMVLKQGKRLELEERLSPQFLREVSRYLNDLRLIQNIFNEYTIYVANLESDEENVLDPNKLLAILIYKNVYPRDFEQLHRGGGTLAKLFNLRDELIELGEDIYRTNIADIEKRLQVAECQTPSNLKELQQIYAMALIAKLPVNSITVGLQSQQRISIQQLVANDEFEQLIEANQIFYRFASNNQTQQIDVSNLQSEVDPQKSYQQRKAEIEHKAADNKNESLQKIRELKSKITALRTKKFNELLRLDIDRVRELSEGFGANGELARFLLLEGYLDDTYYQYTSLFHSGRLSPHDNKFLIQIRAFVTPEPRFQIDNPKEVIAAMRDEDFRQSYVLNVKLVDSLLSDRSHYPIETKKLFEFLSSEFDSCEDFFDAYYASGRDVSGLLTGLATAWKGFVPTAIASSNNISHVTQLVSNLPERLLESLACDFEELPEYVSENLPEILVNSPELAPQRLGYLNFEIKDLVSIKEHSEIINFMFERGLFKLTIPNLEYVYQAILGKNDLGPLRESNFTTIRSTNNKSLINRVERDFDRYLHDILLALPGNSKENAPTILALIRRDALNEDDLREFLERQTTLLPTLEDVPGRLHAMLFELSMIEPSWVNCLDFIEGEVFEADILADYLDRDVVRSVILQSPMPSDPNSMELRRFLFNAGSLSDIAYREYANALPKSLNKLPKQIEPSKLRILIEEGKITFSKEALDAFAGNRDLQVLFVAANLDSYLADPDSFALDDAFKEELLRSDIEKVSKLRLVELMDLAALVGLPDRSALIGSIIDNTDAEIPSLDGSTVQSLVAHSTPIATQISLLNKYHSLLTDDEVRHLLADLPKPLSEIKTGYGQPKLKNTLANQNLVKWLASRNIISSWGEGKLATDDIKVHLYRTNAG